MSSRLYPTLQAPLVIRSSKSAMCAAHTSVDWTTIADWRITSLERCILVMHKCARHTNSYRRISKVDNRRFVTSPLALEEVTMTESMAVAAVDMAADEVEVVVAMEEGEVVDGDGVIRLQKETTRRGVAL